MILGQMSFRASLTIGAAVVIALLDFAPLGWGEIVPGSLCLCRSSLRDIRTVLVNVFLIIACPCRTPVLRMCRLPGFVIRTFFFWMGRLPGLSPGAHALRMRCPPGASSGAIYLGMGTTIGSGIGTDGLRIGLAPGSGASFGSCTQSVAIGRIIGFVVSTSVLARSFLRNVISHRHPFHAVTIVTNVW